MFDTPDFIPCCVGPLIALIVGGIVLAIGTTIEKKVFKKETKHRLSWLITLLMTLIVCSISVSHNVGSSMPYPLLITNKDAIGTWRLSQDSIRYLQRKGYTITAHELVFKADGTFRMDNVPNVWEYLDRSPNGEYITGSGTWRIQQGQSWEIAANFQITNGRVSDTSAHFDFVGLWSPYTLRIWLASWGGIEFYKE